MSITDPSADPVQPEGQGGQGNEAPYQEHLNRIPEQFRGEVEPVFKDWDANVSRKFQEHSEYRKSWEPYEQLGVQKLSPDEVQWLLTFREAHDSKPEEVVKWARDYAQQRGLTFDEAIAETQQQDQGFDEFGGGFDAQAIQKAIESSLSPIQQRLESFAQWQEQQEQQARVAEANQHIRQQLDELKQKHPGEFDEQAVERFLPQYIESDPRNAVPRAWADYQALRAQIEKGFVQTRANATPGAEFGGGTNAAPEPIRSLEAANVAASEWLRERNRQ